MHFVRGQKPILDTLTQAVCVKRITKIAIGVSVIPSERGSSHSELIGRLKIGQNLPPVALILGTTAVALVYDGQVEELRPELSLKTRPMLILRNGLIDREIHLPAFVHFAVFNLPPRIAEGREDLVFGIVDQNVSVCQVKNLGAVMFARSVPSHAPELPANLKGDNGFALFPSPS